MSSRRLIAAIVAIALIAAGAYWYFNGRDGDRSTAIVERGSVDVTIQTVGTLQATGATTIRSTRAGAVDVLGAVAGNRVAAGDIIAVLDMAPFDQAVTDAERALEQAEFTLQQAEQQAAADEANSSLRLDVLTAGDRVERAQIALDEAVQARREAVIISPRDGTVIELLVRADDAINANQPVARIATTADLRIVADVDELDLPNVEPGAEARFRLDAFPATELTGIVASTAPQARQQGGATVFATEITFETVEELDLRPGMNADVTIVTAAREDVLLIPEAALRTVGDRSFVVVITDDGDEEREVQLGYRGAGQVEVVAGLTEGERVVLR